MPSDRHPALGMLRHSLHQRRLDDRAPGAGMFFKRM